MGDTSYKNIHRIFPTKRKDVCEMVEVCAKDENIQKVIVFGSSVTPRCKPWSDIDIYFEMKEPRSNFPSTGSYMARCSMLRSATRL